MYKQIFDNLEKIIDDSSLQQGIKSVDRKIKYENYQDWAVGTVVIGTYKCLTNKTVALIEFKGDFFICIPEKDTNTKLLFTQKLISNEDVNNNLYSENAGLVPVLWSEIAEYQKDRINQTELWEKIFGNDDDLYEFSNLQTYFIELSIWEIDKNQFKVLLDYLTTPANEKNKFVEKNERLLWGIVYQLYGLFLCQQRETLALPYSQDTINKIVNLLETYGSYLSEAVFQGLTSAQWRHSYLEFYRCIERLYPIKRVSELQQKITYTGSTEDLSFILEEELDYRPKESEAITQLFEINLKSEPIINALASHFNFFTIGISENNYPKATAAKIYEYRNAIAHWRKIFDNNKIDIKKVDDTLIGHFCDIIDKLYNKLHLHLKI